MSKIFGKTQSTKDLVKQFKDEAVGAMNAQNRVKMEVELKDVADFFKFILDYNKFNWLPQVIRRELTNQGVHIRKKTGRTTATVTVDNLEKEIKQLKEKLEKGE